MTDSCKTMKIAVYTGTFNPLHVGHLAIMKYLTQKHDFGMVYLVVSPQSPFKEFMKVETGSERYLAALDAVSRHPELSVHVDDIELNLPAPQEESTPSSSAVAPASDAVIKSPDAPAAQDAAKANDAKANDTKANDAETPAE